MNFRTTTKEDMPEIMRVRIGVKENRLANPDSLDLPDIQRMLAGENGRGWLCEVDGQVVGFAIADLATSNGCALFIAPAFERRGIGRTLHGIEPNSEFRFEMSRDQWLARR
jgi:GNAT superfamily N-acetyltransferase